MMACSVLLSFSSAFRKNCRISSPILDLFGNASGVVRENRPFVRELFGNASGSVREMVVTRSWHNRVQPEAVPTPSRSRCKPVMKPIRTGHVKLPKALQRHAQTLPIAPLNYRMLSYYCFAHMELLQSSFAGAEHFGLRGNYP